MSSEEIAGFIAMGLVLGVPALAFATHFVVKPLIREIVEAIQRVGSRDQKDLDDRVARMEEMLLAQSKQMELLMEAEIFRRGLETGRGSPAELGEPGPVPSGPSEKA